MGFLDSYRTAKKLQRMAKEQAKQAQQGAGDPQQLEEIQRMVEQMPQGTDPQAVQARIEAAQQIEQMQGERFGPRRCGPRSRGWSGRCPRTSLTRAAPASSWESSSPASAATTTHPATRSRACSWPGRRSRHAT